VPLDHIGVWEKGGVDVEEMFAGLHAVGYDGYLTVHQAFADVMPIQEAVRRSFQFLKPFCDSSRVADGGGLDRTEKQGRASALGERA
jgi:hypothetical protein